MKWKFEIIARRQNGDVVLHTGHDSETSRDIELQVWKERIKREPGCVASITVISNDESKEERVYP